MCGSGVGSRRLGSFVCDAATTAARGRGTGWGRDRTRTPSHPTDIMNHFNPVHESESELTVPWGTRDLLLCLLRTHEDTGVFRGINVPPTNAHVSPARDHGIVGVDEGEAEG
jgi:hypothetical protein